MVSSPTYLAKPISINKDKFLLDGLSYSCETYIINITSEVYHFGFWMCAQNILKLWTNKSWSIIKSWFKD